MSDEPRADEHDSHEGQCPICGECSCVGCGCRTQPSGLVHIEFGLQPFQHEHRCPKCGFSVVQVTYHPMLVMNVGEGQYPCGSWYRSSILTGEVGEHLCMRCTRCSYGWPTQTADTYRPPREEPDTPLDDEESA